MIPQAASMTSLSNVLGCSPEVLTWHPWEQVVLDLELQAAMEPVHPRRARPIHCSFHLKPSSIGEYIRFACWCRLAWI